MVSSITFVDKIRKVLGCAYVKGCQEGGVLMEVLRLVCQPQHLH